MKKFSKVFASVLMVLTVVSVFSVPVFAFEENAADINKSIESNHENHSVNPDTFGMVSSGYLEVNSDGSVRVTDKYVDYVQKNLAESGVDATVLADDNSITIVENNPVSYRSDGNGGVTKIQWLSSTRFEIYLDSELSSNVADGLSIAGLLSPFIPEKRVAVVIGAALGVSSKLVSLNNKGNGVVASGMLIPTPPGVIFYWIKPQ